MERDANTITPIMASNSQDGFNISSEFGHMDYQGYSYDEYLAFNGALSSGRPDSFVSEDIPNAYPSYLAIQCPYTMRVTGVNLYSRGYNFTYYPIQVSFQRMYNGYWESILDVGDLGFSAPSQKKSFVFDSPVYSNAFRLLVINYDHYGEGYNRISIGEIEWVNLDETGDTLTDIKDRLSAIEAILKNELIIALNYIQNP